MNRRNLLRGLLGGTAVTVGLPVFEYMLGPNGTAFAGGAPLPDRFGVWFWGNGVKPDRWVPASTGASWTPSEELAPLADLVPWVSLVSGTEIKTATHPHHSGMTGILTGQHYHQLGTTRDTIVSTFARQSVDQDAADHLHLNQTPFRSIEAGVCRFRGTDEGSTFEHLSHNGPNNFNPSEYDPHSLWLRLFGAPIEPGTDRARLSVLDAVKDQTDRLKTKLGTNDRDRLEQHLESVRQLEVRLTTMPSTCAPPNDPGSYPDLNGIEQIEAKNLAMSELLTMALACDLTRVFSLMFSSCGSGVIFSSVGLTDGMHLTCHTEANPQNLVHAATTFTMSQLGVFLRMLRDTPEGAGNLLEHCVVMGTTELSDGLTHSNQDFPILIAGHGNGRLRGGYHHRANGLANSSRGVLTALRGAGVGLASWGVDEGATTLDFSELY
ncbi:MAG: DUF1552 domain-containing protein [Alphaproteobacteria bacterium]|nr:DUF1552 domain-containing protein [Alphaproteobacteria bacterium]